ncbi:MAG: hypothetical protein ACM3XM_07665 [Mycobacterium leprae]
MWQVIYIAGSKAVAEQLRDALAAEGILVSLRPVGADGENVPFELLVPHGEAREANELLNLSLGRLRYSKK